MHQFVNMYSLFNPEISPAIVLVQTPNKPSSYVAATLKALQQRVGDFPNHYRADWVEGVISAITKR